MTARFRPQVRRRDEAERRGGSQGSQAQAAAEAAADDRGGQSLLHGVPCHWWCPWRKFEAGRAAQKCFEPGVLATELYRHRVDTVRQVSGNFPPRLDGLRGKRATNSLMCSGSAKNSADRARRGGGVSPSRKQRGLGCGGTRER